MSITLREGQTQATCISPSTPVITTQRDTRLVSAKNVEPIVNTMSGRQAGNVAHDMEFFTEKGGKTPEKSGGITPIFDKQNNPLESPGKSEGILGFHGKNNLFSENLGEATHEKIHHWIVQENAFHLYTWLCNTSVPLKRGNTLYPIIAGNVSKQKAVAKTADGEYERLDLSEQEAEYLRQYSYTHLLENYTTRMGAGISPTNHQLPDQTEQEEADQQSPTLSDERTPTKKALLDRIVELETQIILYQSEKNLWEKLRDKDKTIRKMNYFFSEIERAITRLHTKVKAVDTTHPTLEELSNLFGHIRENLYTSYETAAQEEEKQLITRLRSENNQLRQLTENPTTGSLIQIILVLITLVTYAQGQIDRYKRAFKAANRERRQLRHQFESHTEIFNQLEDNGRYWQERAAQAENERDTAEEIATQAEQKQDPAGEEKLHSRISELLEHIEELEAEPIPTFDPTRIAIQRNKSLLSTEKDVLQAVVHKAKKMVERKQLGSIDQRFRIHIESLNNQWIGTSTGTVSKTLNKLQSMGVLQYDPEDYKDEKGDTYTRAYVMLNREMVEHPERIQKDPDSRPGGARARRKCQTKKSDGAICNSENTDSFIATYCRDDNNVTFEPMPGLRGDANPDALVTAIQNNQYQFDRVLKRYAQESRSRQLTEFRSQNHYDSDQTCTCGREVKYYSRDGQPHCGECWQDNSQSLSAKADEDSQNHDVANQNHHDSHLEQICGRCKGPFTPVEIPGQRYELCACHTIPLDQLKSWRVQRMQQALL